MFHHVAVGVPEGRCPSPYVGMMDSFNDFIHITIKPENLFARLTTVLVSAKDGIYALVGKLRQGTKETVTCEYMFDSEKGWTQQKAEQWIETQNNTTKNSVKIQEKVESKPEPEESLDAYEVLAKSRRLLCLR